jgi:hypothetical protein
VALLILLNNLIIQVNTAVPNKMQLSFNDFVSRYLIIPVVPRCPGPKILQEGNLRISLSLTKSATY